MVAIRERKAQIRVKSLPSPPLRPKRPSLPPSMDADASMSTGIGSKFFGDGIQALSPFLPLLGTGQCEELVTAALQRGLLYAAATPMSIFGSLGIAKAGFIVLCTSVDNSTLHGPALLRNAGFIPSGIGSLLMRVIENNRQLHLYVAEEKIANILSKKRIRSAKINLWSEDLLWWNVHLFLATIIFASLGILPYIYIILHLQDRRFIATWLFPCMRVYGCATVAFTIQIIFQLRILEETYCRIRFMAIDGYLKDYGQSLPVDWDPNDHSKEILKRLKRLSPLKLVRQGLGTISDFTFPIYSEEPKHQPDNTPANLNNAERGLTGGLVLSHRQKLLYDFTSIYYTTVFSLLAQIFLFIGCGATVVGYVGCFSLVQLETQPNWKAPTIWLCCELGLAVLRMIMWAWNPAWDDARSPIALEKIPLKPTEVPGRQENAEENAEEREVVEEIMASADDILPIEENVRNEGTAIPRGNLAGGEQEDDEENEDVREALDAAMPPVSSSYGIGWGLDRVTADDTHALIVGIDAFGCPGGVRDLQGCVADAKKVAKYLEETLLVPRNQIVSLRNKKATKERIIQELKLLSEKLTVTDDAPIVIYFATHSFVEADGQRTYLIPYQGTTRKGKELLDASVPYDTIVKLLQRIGEKKTENITLILDTCHAGAMGQNGKFDTRNLLPSPVTRADSPQPNTSATGGRGMTPDWGHKHKSLKTTELLVGHSSHVLLAGTLPEQLAREDRGEGVFTHQLLEVLKAAMVPPESRPQDGSNHLGRIEAMRYKDLIDAINRELEKTPGQQALCTSIYQNRLLFSGLFSRRIVSDVGGSTPLITVQYSDDI